MNPAAMRFLRRHGWAGAAATPIAGDASMRRYHRLSRADGTSAILMQAPPAERQVLPFWRVDLALAAIGLSVPDILAGAPDDGLLLIEDFGDAVVSDLLDTGADPAPIYAGATDVLIAIAARADLADAADPAWRAQPRFDAAAFSAQLALLPRMLGCDASATRTFESAWQVPFARLEALPRAPMLRDYHAGNLMRLDGRAGPRRWGLLDFQDAGIGPLLYDLVSLLEDARRDVPAAIVAAERARYIAALPALAVIDIEAAWAGLAAIRHLRVIAVFRNLAMRHGKPGYLAHLPRIEAYLARHLAHPELSAVRAWLRRHAADLAAS